MLSCIPVPSSRALLHITVSILCFLALVTSRPTQNITIEVPYGTTNHGEPNMLCTPATWSDIARYLLFNYVAHGATVVSYPGEPAFDIFLYVVIAILFPTFGVIRSLNFTIRHPVLTAKNDLEMAARSGALCMLVRSSSWKPQKGDDIRNALIKGPGNEPPSRGHNTSRSGPGANVSPTTAALSIYTPPWLNDKTRFWSYTDTDLVGIGSRVVFVLTEPPDQYRFAFVPRNTKVLGLVDSTPTSSSFASLVSTPRLSSPFNLVRGMAALLQFLYASFTFYRTIGGQVNRYGFAAPGFTVLPYAVMSALNLMANLVAPHYPTLYLVRSEVMEEAEWRTGLPFDYVVGKVVESGTNNTVPEGWSEIAGSFKDDDKLLYVSPSAGEDEKIEICDSYRQTIYVPACPRFRRTDDTQTSPLRQFIESDQRWLEFPQYQFKARRQQVSIQPSWFSFLRPSFQLDLQSYIEVIQSRLRSHLGALRSSLLRSISHWPWVLRPFASFSIRFATRPDVLTVHEQFLIAFIIYAEFFITLALSNFSGQQSTLAQRAWTVTWLIVGHTSGIMIRPAVSTMWELDTSPVRSRFVVCCYMVICGPPAIGGFVVVSQMLKAYGICYKVV